jgi:acyl-coenzyme A thioesterase 13
MHSTLIKYLPSRAEKKTGKESSPFTNWLAPVLLSARKGHIVCAYEVRHEMTNAIGILHGGVTAAFIDDAIAATLSAYGERTFYVTLSNMVDYFLPVPAGQRILAETLVIKKGRRIVSVQCELRNPKNNRLIARGYSNLIRTGIPKDSQAASPLPGLPVKKAC